VLEAEGLVRRIGGRRVVDEVSLAVSRSEVLCLLGPSGCGKSTTLRMIAGVERPDGGRIRLDGEEVSGPDRFVPPERRSVGLMFQDFALFPHLDIARNVAFGLRDLPRADRERRALDLLGRVGLADHVGRYPHELSGGEQQRVALARALAPGPRLMLMDEPFSGLDDRLRDGVRDATISLLAESGTSALLVTHDPGEAMRVADRIALLRAGRIVQLGSPHELYERPSDRRVAEFFSDVNVFTGTVAGSEVETALGRFTAPGLADGTAAEVVVRPHHLRVTAGGDPNPEAGGAAVHLERIRFIGRESLLDLRTGGGLPVRAVLPGALSFEPGARLWISVARDHAFVFDAVPRD
jgi:iron(III) transport system ATP-binding protein